MPVYEFRLEAQDGSGHFRRGGIAADSEQEARAILEAREIDSQLTALSTEELSALEAEYGADVIRAALALPADAKMPRDLPGHVRAKLAIHRQRQPYKIKSLKARG